MNQNSHETDLAVSPIILDNCIMGPYSLFLVLELNFLPSIQIIIQVECRQDQQAQNEKNPIGICFVSRNRFAIGGCMFWRSYTLKISVNAIYWVTAVALFFCLKEICNLKNCAIM